jgi:hypothetical protein
MRQVSEGGGGGAGAAASGMSVLAKGRLRFKLRDSGAFLRHVVGAHGRTPDAWPAVMPCGAVEVELIGEGSLAPPGPPKGAFARGLVRPAGGGGTRGGDSRTLPATSSTPNTPLDIARHVIYSRHAI